MPTTTTTADIVKSDQYLRTFSIINATYPIDSSTYQYETKLS